MNKCAHLHIHTEKCQFLLFKCDLNSDSYTCVLIRGCTCTNHVPIYFFLSSALGCVHIDSILFPNLVPLEVMALPVTQSSSITLCLRRKLFLCKCACFAGLFYFMASREHGSKVPSLRWSNGESTRWLTFVFLSLSLSLWPVVWRLPAVIKLVIYSKQRCNPVTAFPSFFHKTIANVWWREKRVLNGYWSDVIWISFSLSFFSDGCGAGIVCLNVSTLEELHSCGRLDHIGGFTERTDTHTRTRIHTYRYTHTFIHTHHSLTLWQAAMLGWQLNNTKLLSVSGQAWLNPRYIIGTHTHWLCLSQTRTQAHMHFEKVPFLFFFSLKPGSNLLFSGN